MPDFQVLPNATTGMSREEVSVLSSARREEMRRLQEENERLRANPLLYLVSPHVKVRTECKKKNCFKKNSVSFIVEIFFTYRNGSQDNSYLC